MTRARHTVMALTIILQSGPAAAQSEPDSGVARAAIESCLAESQSSDAEGCIGAFAETCMETPDGYTTTGMTQCVMTEQKAWDAVLNESYKARMAAASALDKERDEMGITSDNEAAAMLRIAQRAWIAFRDAECDRTYEFYKDGTIRSPIFAGCMNDMTANRAIALWREGL